MKNNTRISQLLLVSMVVVYAMLFEWRSIFELKFFLPIVYLLKCAIPLALFFFTLRFKQIPKYKAPKRYIIFFTLFILWGFFSSFFSIVPKESLIQWLKFIPLLIFSWFICAYSLYQEEAQKKIMKLFIAIAIFTVIQYIFLEIGTFTGLAQSFNLPTHRGGVYYGLYGLLGQGSGNVYFKSLGFFLYRLYGFWLEPSTALGFLLTASFFAESLYLETRRKKWRIFACICFVGAIFTFSTVGYMAIALCGLMGEVFYLKVNKTKKVFHFTMALFFILLFLYSVLGRYIVAKYFSKNVDLRYITGVRSSVDKPYDGRVEIVASNIKTILTGFENNSTTTCCEDPAITSKKETAITSKKETAITSKKETAITSGRKLSTKIVKNILFGIGFRIAGCDERGRGFIISASAFPYWLTFAGIIGLLFLLLRELQVILAIYKNIFASVFVLRISQAWLALFAANMNYGTLTNPFYLITVAFVFSSIYHFKKRGNIE